MYTQHVSQHALDSLPRTIWIPKFSKLPSCYSGTPVEMMHCLANDMGPSVRVDDAISYLIQDMEEDRGVTIEIPDPEQAPQEVRAAMVVLVSLVTGYAREVPSC